MNVLNQDAAEKPVNDVETTICDELYSDMRRKERS